MKQTRLWLTTIAVLLCSVTASAYDFEVDSIYYDIISTEDLTVKVTSGDNRYSGEVIIPSTITYKSRTLTVVSIGDNAFSRCSSLTAITLPESVTSIGEFAFGGCTGLTSITIPNSVTSIGEGAFVGCTSLKDLRIEDGETVLSYGKELFDGCPLEELYLGRNLLHDNSPFCGITTMTMVTIGDSVTSIGESAFYGCSGLTSITIPNSVTSIGNYAFYGCTSLKELYMEDGRDELSLGRNESSGEIYRGLFHDCPLETLYLGRDIDYKIFDRDYPYYRYESPFYEKKTLLTVTIGDSVTHIAIEAFYRCSGLTSITIPNSVTSIGESAFYGCIGLTSITIPNSVKTIGRYAFEWCSGLTSIKIPNNVEEIHYYAFGYCTSMKELFVEDGDLPLKFGSYGYGQSCFAYCPLESIYLGRNIYLSEQNEYQNLFASINSVRIGNRVTRIIEEVLDGIAKYANIYLMGTIPPKASECGDSPYVNWNIYVPQGSLAAYLAADVWKNFWNIQEYYLDKYFYINYVVNGEPYATDSVKHGDTIIPKEVAVKEGQTFSGWIDLPETMPANDITVYGTINIEPEAILLNKQTIITTVNSAYQLYATVYPEDATNKTVIWTSSDESVAKVSDSGYVTGISVGKATITASCGNVSASCDVEVEVENFIKTQPTSENLLVELNTPEEGVKYQWHRLVEGMIYSKKIVPISSGEYAWTESNGVWTSGNNKEGPQTFSVMTATVRVQLGDTISFDYTVPKGDGRNDGGSQWFKFTLKGETNMQTFGGVNGGAGHYELDINDYIINRKLNKDSTMTVGFECVRKNSERATVSNIKHTRPTGFYRGMVAEEIIGATTARLQDSLFVEGSVVYCVATLPNGRTLTSDKVNMYKVYYYVGEELVHVAEVPYGEVIPEYVYEPTNEDDEFLGWIGETYETMPAHDVTYTANIESGINQLLLDNGQLIIYDLMGRKVLNMENLKGGIYIVNGKKVVFK